MSDPAPPDPGQTLWGDDLNTYLLSLEDRIAANEARFDAQTAQITQLEASVQNLVTTTNALAADVQALETKPEYVYNSFPWQFSNQAPPATGNQVRLNNVDPTLATEIDIRKEDSDGADRTPVFQQLAPGDTIRINDWNDAAHLYRYEVNGPPMIGATNVQIPVAWVNGSGTVLNAKATVAFLVSIVI